MSVGAPSTRQARTARWCGCAPQTAQHSCWGPLACRPESARRLLSDGKRMLRRVIEGRWVEKAGQRRRGYYRITEAGRAAIKSFVGERSGVVCTSIVRAALR